MDTESAPVVDAIIEFAPMADTTQVFSAATGADGSYSIHLEPLSTAVEEGGARSQTLYALGKPVLTRSPIDVEGEVGR